MPHIPVPVQSPYRALSPSTSAGQVRELSMNLPKRRKVQYREAVDAKPKLGLQRYSWREWDQDPDDVYRKLFEIQR